MGLEKGNEPAVIWEHEDVLEWSEYGIDNVLRTVVFEGLIPAHCQIPEDWEIISANVVYKADSGFYDSWKPRIFGKLWGAILFGKPRIQFFLEKRDNKSPEEPYQIGKKGGEQYGGENR